MRKTGEFAMIRLFVGAAAAAMFAYPATSIAQIVEIKHLPPKAGTQTDIGTTRIVVTGSTEDKYDKVVTTSLDAWVSVRAPDKPPRDKDKLNGTVEVEGENVLSTGAFPSSPAIYKLTFPYRDPRSQQVANQRISPIEICNDKLASLSGAAREKFRDEGGLVLRHDAYMAVAEQRWRVRTQGSVFEEIKGWKDTAGIPAVIDCRRLTGPKPRDKTTTKGADTRPPAKKMEPTIVKVTLRGEPQAWEMVGGQSCPTQVRLYGFVEVRRAFSGKSIFFGPGFLTPPQNLSFTDAGSRTLTATHNVKWASGPAGLTAGGNRPAAPKRQQVTLRFNVADADGKVLESATTNETLICRPGGAPTRVRS